MKHSLRIGVTGGIGSGKSTVCRLLETMGYPVYYSDDEAKRLMHEDPKLIAEISDIFGETIYQDKKLDRKKVAAIVFNDNSARDRLNAVVHPRVRQDFAEWTERQDSALVFQESALLFETGNYKRFDASLLVVAPEEIRIQRVMARDGSDYESVRARIANQFSDEEKIKLADFVIWNDDTQLVITQVENCLKQVLSR